MAAFQKENVGEDVEEDEMSISEGSSRDDTDDPFVSDEEVDFSIIQDAEKSAKKLHDQVKLWSEKNQIGAHGFVAGVYRKGDTVFSDLGVNTDRLTPTCALAWGIDPECIIMITVAFSDAGIKLISLEPDSIRIYFQIKKIVEGFLEGSVDTFAWASECSDAAFCDNMLTKIISYTWYRLKSVHMHCTVCDERHDDGISMINPTVCRRPLCGFSSQLYAKFLPKFDYMGGIRGCQNELLRLFFFVAVMSTRCKAILKPWPTLYAPDRSVLVDESTSEETLIAATMNMKEEERLCDKCAGPLCIKCALESWIIASNRSTILMLSEEQQNPYWNTKFQYLLLSNPPELEEKFQLHKEKYGSKFYYHGSPTDNWHGILRNGFFVASGTSLQLHGHAHGKGVYVTSEMGTAAGYTRIISAGTWKGMKIPGYFTMTFIAVCEVINHPVIVKDHGWCKTVSEAEYIVPRFMLGWKANTPKIGGAMSSVDPKVHQWCVDTMSSIK